MKLDDLLVIARAQEAVDRQLKALDSSSNNSETNFVESHQVVIVMVRYQDKEMWLLDKIKENLVLTVDDRDTSLETKFVWLSKSYSKKS